MPQYSSEGQYSGVPISIGETVTLSATMVTNLNVGIAYRDS